MYLTKEQQKLVEDNVDLVPYAVKKYLAHVYIEFDDKVSIGYYWLCRAAYFYKPESGNTFSTFAIKVIVRGVMRYAQHELRQKRGGNCVTVSLDKKLQAVNEEVPDDEDVEEGVLDRVLCEPVWKLVPTYVKIQKKGMTQNQYAKSIGKSAQCITNWLQREYAIARGYLESRGVFDAHGTV